jgi:hypothetical protein
VFDPLLILRDVTVAPVAVPAFNPMLYGVVFVHWTCTVEVWLIAVAITPDVPKFKLDELEIAQDALIVSCIEKVFVVLAALTAVTEPASIRDASKTLHLITLAPERQTIQTY